MALVTRGRRCLARGGGGGGGEVEVEGSCGGAEGKYLGEGARNAKEERKERGKESGWVGLEEVEVEGWTWRGRGEISRWRSKEREGGNKGE